MAKLYKLELYITDYNDVYENTDDLIGSIQSGWGFDDVLINCFNPKEVNIDWHDEIDLNYDNVEKQVYDKYFK